jgi:predicted enzyme related to lactoylglutathione lyase
MKISQTIIVLDAADLATVSSFWAGLLGGTVEDAAAAHDEAVALGARLLQAADDLASGSGFQVYADPAGHPFCLCWG